MKVFILFILFFSVGFSQAIEKFSEDFNIYVLKKSKEQLENLHKSAKLSLKGSTNDRLNQNNLLTTRNSRLSDTVSDMILSSRQILVLNTMEEAANDLVATNQNFNCANIALHNLSKNINMSLSECVDLNNTLKNFFNAGAFSLSIPNGSLLQLRASDVRFDDLNDSGFLIKNIERSILKNIELEKQISFMNGGELKVLCNDIAFNSTTYLSKQTITKKVDSRTRLLDSDPNYNLTRYDLYNARILCGMYNFSKLNSKVSYDSSSVEIDEVANLELLINEAKKTLDNLNYNLVELQKEIVDLQNNPCSLTPNAPPCRQWKSNIDQNFNEITNIQNEITNIQQQMDDLNNKLEVAKG